MEDNHGIWPWTVALVAGHSATNHHFARDFHASLKQLGAGRPDSRSH